MWSMNDSVRMMQETLDQGAFSTTNSCKVVLNKSIQPALSRYNGGWSRKIEAFCDIRPRTLKDAGSLAFP